MYPARGEGDPPPVTRPTRSRNGVPPTTIAPINSLDRTESYPSVSTCRWNRRNGFLPCARGEPREGETSEEMEREVCVTSVCADGRFRIGEGENVNSTSRMDPGSPENRRIVVRLVECCGYSSSSEEDSSCSCESSTGSCGDRGCWLPCRIMEAEPSPEEETEVSPAEGVILLLNRLGRAGT